MTALPPRGDAAQPGRIVRRAFPGGAEASRLLAAGLLAGLLAVASPGWAGTECVNDQTPDAVICPPPDGELVINRQGGKVCAPGWCVEDVEGKIKCSGVPGGAALLDHSGHALCVGGCQEAGEALCRRLELPRF